METTRPPGFPGNPLARMPRASTPARSRPPRPLRSRDVAFRPTQGVGPRTQCISGLNHAAYALPVNASRPGSPQAHASLGSGWRPALAGWDWIPTGFRTRFQRSRHGILFPLTGLSRHTRGSNNPRAFARNRRETGSLGTARSATQSPRCSHSGIARGQLRVFLRVSGDCSGSREGAEEDEARPRQSGGQCAEDRLANRVSWSGFRGIRRQRRTTVRAAQPRAVDRKSLRLPAAATTRRTRVHDPARDRLDHRLR